MTTRRIAIPPRHYAVFDLECNLQEGKFDIKPDLYLQQQEPNLWMDSFILYNMPCKDHDNAAKDIKDFAEEAEITSPKKTKVKKSEDTSEDSEDANKNVDKVCIPYSIFNLSYENHSYITRDRVLTFAVREENEETKVFKVEEVKTQQEYSNWIPKKKGNLPVPPKSNFICSPAEVSLHRKLKLKSKPVKEDTAQGFDKLWERFPEIISKNSKDIGRTNFIIKVIDTGNHPPICQKPYTLALEHYD